MRRTRAGFGALSGHRFQREDEIVEEDEDDLSLPETVAPKPPLEPEEIIIQPEKLAPKVSLECVEVVIPENAAPTTPLESDQQLVQTYLSARRSSVTNVAISSSLGPSLAGIFPVLQTDSTRRATLASIFENPDALASFRAQHQHHHHHHHMLPHLHMPQFMLTGPLSEGGRRFSFGIRRHSHTVSFMSTPSRNVLVPGCFIELLLAALSRGPEERFSRLFGIFAAFAA